MGPRRYRDTTRGFPLQIAKSDLHAEAYSYRWSTFRDARGALRNVTAYLSDIHPVVCRLVWLNSCFDNYCINASHRIVCILTPQAAWTSQAVP